MARAMLALPRVCRPCAVCLCRVMTTEIECNGNLWSSGAFVPTAGCSIMLIAAAVHTLGYDTRNCGTEQTWPMLVDPPSCSTKAAVPVKRIVWYNCICRHLY